MSFPQHVWKAVCPASIGKGRKQIGQSSRGGCSLNSSSSCNSATLLSHAFLCFDRCFFLHAALQYWTILHLLHVLRLPPSLPHEAHAVEEVSIDDMVHVLCFNLILRDFDFTFLPCEWYYFLPPPPCLLGSTSSCHMNTNCRMNYRNCLADVVCFSHHNSNSSRE